MVSKAPVRDLAWSLRVFTWSFFRGTQREPQHAPPQTQGPAFGQQRCLSQTSLMASLTASLELLFMISRRYTLFSSFWPPSACHHHLPIILLPFITEDIELCHFFQCATEPAHMYLHNYLREKKKKLHVLYLEAVSQHR